MGVGLHSYLLATSPVPQRLSAQYPHNSFQTISCCDCSPHLAITHTGWGIHTFLVINNCSVAVCDCRLTCLIQVPNTKMETANELNSRLKTRVVMCLIYCVTVLYHISEIVDCLPLLITWHHREQPEFAHIYH